MRANGTALIAEVERHLASRDAADWTADLAKRGIPASPICTIEAAAAWPQVRERHLLERAQIANGERELDVVGSGIVFEHNGPSLRGPLPEFGEYTREALRGAGYDAEAIASLFEGSIIGCADGMNTG